MPQVMNGIELAAENLAATVEMAQVRASVVSAGVAAATLIERLRV